jgi:hypothetical protein
VAGEVVGGCWKVEAGRGARGVVGGGGGGWRLLGEGAGRMVGEGGGEGGEGSQ